MPGYIVNVLFCFDSIHTDGRGREPETGDQRREQTVPEEARENGQMYVHTIYGLKFCRCLYLRPPKIF